MKNNKKLLLQQIGQYFVDRLRNLAPKDTENLAFDSIKLVFKGRNKIEIYVSLAQAPYMPFTNEPWTSPRWNGKQNPNEAWWNDAIELIMKEIAIMTGGILTNA